MLTNRQSAHLRGLPVDNVVNINQVVVPEVAQASDFILSSRLPTIAGAVTVEDTAYFVYLGTLKKSITALKIFFHVSAGGTGAQTAAECGLFSSPTAPNRAAQTLTKIVATGTLGDLTGTGVLGNTTSFAQDIAAGTHLWAGLRTAMATNEPTVFGLTADMSHGRILSTATAGALTASSTFAGALIAAAVAWQAPALTLHVS